MTEWKREYLGQLVPDDRIPDRHRGRVEPLALASPLSVAAVRHSAVLDSGIMIHADPDCPRDTFGIVSDGKVTWHPVPVVVRETDPTGASKMMAARAARTGLLAAVGERLVVVEAAIRTAVREMGSVPSSLYAERDRLRRSFAEYNGVAIGLKVEGGAITIRTSAGDVSITSDPTLRPGEFAIRDTPAPPNPLDVEYDGHPLRWLLKMDAKARQENVTAQCTRSCFTPAQRAAVSAHLSAELRAKVAAGKAAAKEREVSVRCDGDWLDEVEW